MRDNLRFFYYSHYPHNIFDYNFYPIPQTRRSNMRHRPIGIGVQGLANVFYEMGISFDSPEAKEVNKNIFESIYYLNVTFICKINILNFS